MAFKQLTKVFERSETSRGRALPIRRTGRGIWVRTPVRVIEEAIETLNGKLVGATSTGGGALLTPALG